MERCRSRGGRSSSSSFSFSFSLSFFFSTLATKSSYFRYNFGIITCFSHFFSNHHDSVQDEEEEATQRQTNHHRPPYYDSPTASPPPPCSHLRRLRLPSPPLRHLLSARTLSYTSTCLGNLSPSPSIFHFVLSLLI